MVVILLVGLIALTSWLIAPGVARQSDQIAASFPRAVSEYQRTLEQYDWGRYLIEQSKNMRPERLAEGGDGRGGVAGLLWSSVNFGVDFIVVVFVGLFLAVNPRRYLEGALRLIPEGRRPRGREVLHDMGHWMGRWLLGRFISMVVIGTATGVGLWLLGVPLAATLGLLTGLLDFIPTFGPILAAIPTALVALTVGPMMAVYALADVHRDRLLRRLRGHAARPDARLRAAAGAAADRPGADGPPGGRPEFGAGRPAAGRGDGPRAEGLRRGRSPEGRPQG